MAIMKDGYAQVFENCDFYNKNESPSEDPNGNTSKVLFKYSWTIQLKDGLLSMPKTVISPEFPNRANSGITWYLTATWPGSIIGVNLSLASCNVQNVNANYRYSMRNSSGAIILHWLDAANKVFKLNEPLDILDVIQLCPKNQSMPSDSVTIDCEITVPAFEVYPAPNQITSENKKTSVFQFTEKLLAMFDNEEFCDVTFSVNEKELKTHKVILAAGSPAFKVMFRHDILEKNHNRVVIKDIQFEVLRELIRYIYTNQVSDLEKIAEELLVASDKYHLEKLKNMCESVLCKTITTENVAQMFIFAHTFNAVFLKEVVKEFIVDHSKDVSNTAGWQSMVKTHPHLIAEAFIALSDK